MLNTHFDITILDKNDYYNHINYIIKLSKINNFKSFSFNHLYTKFYKFSLYNRNMRKNNNLFFDNIISKLKTSYTLIYRPKIICTILMFSLNKINKKPHFQRRLRYINWNILIRKKIIYKILNTNLIKDITVKILKYV
jgi:hypothetical protein